MTDERDPKVSQRYRELAPEEPSRELDQAILAAAHRSVDKPHAPLLVPAGRHRWYFSLAAVAVLMLAIGVTLHVERQPADAELAVSPPAPASQPSKVEAIEQSAPAETAKLEAPLRKERSSGYAPDVSPPAPAASPPTAMARRAAAEPAAGARADAERAPSVASSRAAASPKPSIAPMAASAAPTLEQELERIAELRRTGRNDEADKALAEFRKRYPDYVIPEAMRARVERN